jgi:hypothetical protein
MLKKPSNFVLTRSEPATYLRQYVSAQDTTGSPPRRRAQMWHHLFVAPCASLRHRSGRGASWRAWGERVKWSAFLNILMSHDLLNDSKTRCSLSTSILAAVLCILVGGCGVPLEEQKAHIRKHSLPFQVLSMQAFLETWGKPTYVHQETTQFYPVKSGNYVPRFRTSLGEPPSGWDASVVSEPAIFLGYTDRGELLGFIDSRLVYREQLTASQIHEIGKNWQHEAIFKTRLETDFQAPPKP